MRLLAILQRRGFAERPTSKKAAVIKKLQNDAKADAPLVEIKLPAVGESLRNINISVGQSDPLLQPDSSYPQWIWSARGPCRAALRITGKSNTKSEATATASSSEGEFEKLAEFKKYLRSENRKSIRRNNSILESASQ